MDSDEIISCYDREELEKFKEWLFNENVRVSTEKKELEEKKKVKSEKVCKLFSVENDIKLPSSWPSF